MMAMGGARAGWNNEGRRGFAALLAFLASPDGQFQGLLVSSLIKFEGGYNIKTLFKGNRFGIDLYSVHDTPTGELLILDSTNSNLYKVSTPLSPRVTTIAGGKQNGRSRLDGPTVEAILSDDFDMVYVAGSCSLLIIDRGYQAIREIQLDYDDCPSQSSHQDGDFQFLGIAALMAAGFFGYMVAMLVQRVRALFSSRSERRILQLKSSAIAAPYQRLPRPAMPPMIADEDEPVKPEEGFLSSFLSLIFNTVSTMAEILAAIIFWGFRKKQLTYPKLHHYDHYQNQHPTRHVDT
ncbi:hypothetical protein Drorol1_Dr00012707 [Drosera rotundifolia]